MSVGLSVAGSRLRAAARRAGGATFFVKKDHTSNVPTAEKL